MGHGAQTCLSPGLVHDVVWVWCGVCQYSYHIGYGEHHSRLYDQTTVYEDSWALELCGTTLLGWKSQDLLSPHCSDQAVHQGTQLLLWPLPTALPGSWLGLSHSI